MPAVRQSKWSDLEQEFGPLYDEAYERWKKEHPELTVVKRITFGEFEVRDGVRRIPEPCEISKRTRESLAPEKCSPLLLYVCCGVVAVLMAVAVFLIFDAAQLPF